MKKIGSFILALVLILSMPVNAFAAERAQNNSFKYGTAEVAEEARKLLDTMTTTQTIVASEAEMIEKMLADGSITREYLNSELAALSRTSIDELKKKGYSADQISIISSYQVGTDAYDHVFNSNPAEKSSTRALGEVTFRYGLAGSNTKRDITIAYDMTWSTCPLFTFTDCFGVGWIAADSNSHEVVTETISSMAQVQYYTRALDDYTGVYSDVTMDSNSNGVVIGTPVMGHSDGYYGKHISGVTKIRTQSGSYNIETIQLFVAYAHTVLAINVDLDIILEWEKVSGAINFIPRPRHEIMAQGHANFRYYSQGYVTC